MKHVCKDMSQGIHPEPSDEVRGGKGKEKEKEKENAVAYFQTNAAQPGSNGIKTGLHIQSLVAEARVL